jgi:cell division protein FtsW (lipid II flippase)
MADSLKGRRAAAVAGLTIPVVIGAVVMGRAGAGTARVGVHLGGALAGWALCWWSSTRARETGPRVARLWGLLLVATVAATWLDPGIQGIHRWIAVGGVRLHPSALLAPAFLATAFAGRAGDDRWTVGLFGVIQALHLLQPDAGQASACAAGALAGLLAGERTRPRTALAAFAVVAAAVAWLRPDPLLPAPFVEDMVGRAFHWRTSVGLASLACLAIGAVAPLVLIRETASEGRSAPWALAGYLAGAMLATAAGELPVPLMGFGVSPLLGTFLGLALLLASGHPTRGGSR